MAANLLASFPAVSGTATTRTLSVTVPAGSNRLLVIKAAGVSSADGITTATCTVNGVSAGAQRVLSTSSSSNNKVAFWAVVDPTAGTYNVVVTTSASTAVTLSAELWADIDPTTPIAATDQTGSSSSSSPITRTMAAASGQVITDLLSIRANGSVLTPTGTRIDTAHALSTIAVSSASYTDGPVSGASWSWVTGTNAAYAALLLNSVVAGTPATETTLSGPASGVVGVASSDFTAGANGDITGTVEVTPNDGGAGGTFTPTSVNISSGTPTATFTYTPASTGLKSISINNDGGLTDADSLGYTVEAAPVAVAFDGTVPDQGAAVSVPFTLALAGYFSGTETPFAYTLQAGTLPAGLSLNGSTGAISGTPSGATTATGLVVRATDSGSDTADTNAFAITVTADDVTNPTFTGPVALVAYRAGGFDLAYPAGSDNVAVTGYEVSVSGGAYASVGNVLDPAIATALPGNLGAVLVRAFDAAGNESTPAVAPALGVLGSAVPDDGEHGPGALWDWLQGPGTGNGSNLVHAHITTWPASGTLEMYPDSSFLFTPAGDGEVTCQVQAYVNGVASGSPFELVLQSGEVVPGDPPTINTHPSGQTVLEGATASFSVSASGDAPLSYQWTKNGSNIGGATSSSYTTPATTLADNAAAYRCVVTNPNGSTTSNPATLTVTALPVGTAGPMSIPAYFQLARRKANS